MGMVVDFACLHRHRHLHLHLPRLHPLTFVYPSSLHFHPTPRPPSLRSSFSPPSSMSSPSTSLILHDLSMGLVTLSGALATLRFWEELAKRNVFSKKVNRKLVHISAGLVFVLFWPLFSDGAWAPYIAAFSAAANGLRVVAIGLGILKDDATVKSMTREGDPKELLKGPFYYSMTIALVTTYIWRTSPLAPIIIANLCAGDGFADLFGRRFGKAKLPYNTDKSYIGTLAMVVFGFIFSLGYECYLSYFGFYELNMELVISTFIISSVTAFVESLPISTSVDDNLTVPLTAFIVGKFLI